MKRIAAALLFAALPICAAAPVQAHDDAATACVELGGVSIWGLTGWNHVVYVTNRCDKPLVCDVWTDVEPEKRKVTCTSDVTVYVSTALASETQWFVPAVSCDFE